MSRAVLYKIAAVALLVGAVLSAAGNLLAPQGDARSAVASGMYYPAAVAVLLGSHADHGRLAGWPAPYLRYRVESGVLGLAGAAAVFVAGMSLTVGWSTVQAVVFPWMATTNISNKALDAGRCPSPSSSQWPAPSWRWVASCSELRTAGAGRSRVMSVRRWKNKTT